MIHIFSGMWPEPQIGQNRIEGEKLIPVSEAERRKMFLKVIQSDHPLMDLIHRCISNDPRVRPDASEIVAQFAKIMLQFPADVTNRSEMLRHTAAQEEEKKILKTKKRECIV